MKYKFKQAILIPIDLAIIVISFILAAIVHFDGTDVIFSSLWKIMFSWSSAAIPVVYIICFTLFDMYAFMLRQTTLEDLLKCVVANVIAAVFSEIYNFAVIEKIFKNGSTAPSRIPTSVMLIGAMLILFCTLALRCLPRIVHEISQRFEMGKSPNTHNVLIYGAGFSGKTLAADLRNAKDREFYRIVGFVDDKPGKIDAKLSGIKVYSASNDLDELVHKLKVDMIVIAIPSLSPHDLSEIVEKCKHTGCKLKTVSTMRDIEQGKDTKSSGLRDISIDDILHRKETNIDIDSISQYISDETVMVTGAGGSIGSELCRRILQYRPKRLVLFDIYENNVYDLELELRNKFASADMKVYIGSVRDYARIDYVMKKEKPAVIFHAAAHKHVPLMENSPGEAIKNNVFGTYNLAKAADANGVRTFVFISTDKAVNPTNVMGATKRMCEMIITAMDKVSNTRYVAVRFGNVLGSNGSVVPLFKKQIAEMGPVTVTHPEITRFFMTIPEAARLVVQAGAMAKGGEIFILDMGEPVKIADLARDMIRLSGYVPDRDIKIVYTGLRPGEKLYEELMQAEEGTTKSSYDGIFIAKPETLTIEQVEEKIEKLRNVIGENDETVVKCLSEAVPTFYPEKAGMSFYGKR